MFARIFGRPRQEDTNALVVLDRLSETLEMLQKKEEVFQRKADAEVERARQFTKAKNKRAAIQCLKRKKLYELRAEELVNFQMRIFDQINMIEGATATTDTVAALRTGAAAMREMQNATNINNVDRIMDEINQQTENMRQLQDLLSAPIGAAADLDEDELEAELEELAVSELEEELTKPSTTVPPAPMPAEKQPAKRVDDEYDELVELQREMAL